jgi:hypothetical protein
MVIGARRWTSLNSKAVLSAMVAKIKRAKMKMASPKQAHATPQLAFARPSKPLEGVGVWVGLAFGLRLFQNRV